MIERLPLFSRISNPLKRSGALFTVASALCCGLGIPVASQAEEQIECLDNKVCRNTATFLPVRVLPRPFSTIYSDKDVNSEVFSSDVTAFRPLYVFDRVDIDLTNPQEAKGWYRIGASEKIAFGWIQAKDAIEWRQALLVSYTPQGSGENARKRVIGFTAEENLRNVVESSDRDTEAEKRYTAISNKQKPDDVITLEPPGDLDIDEHFYMIPVLDWKEATTFDEPYPRYLQLVSAVPKERDTTGTKSTLENKSFAAEVAGDATVRAAQHMESQAPRSVEIVFAMDLTGSMEPFIGLTKSAIHTFGLLVGQNLPANIKVRFGFVGYRDNAEMVPGMEFTARNFTPSLLESSEFARLLDSDVHAATVSSLDYQEEVFPGIKEAVGSAWSDDTALRLIVLVGDASSHEPGHERNVTGLGAEEVRRLADENNVYLIALHLQDPEDSADWALATEQFSALSRNPGDEAPAYLPVEAHNATAYEESVKIIASIVAARLSGAKPASSAQQILPSAQMPKTATGVMALDIADRIAQNAMVDYLGDEQDAQTDVTFWAFDRDITDPETPALRVHVLLSRAELENLVRAIESVTEAFKIGLITGSGFMHTLQGVLALGTHGKEIDVKKAASLADTKLLPAWIEKLPYRSQVLGFSDAVIEGMSAEDKAVIERNLDAKLALYKELMETDSWNELHEGDAPINHVHPLPLQNLP